MPKYYQGMSFEKVTVKHGDDEQEVVIAMTEKESKDQAYREELGEFYKDKTLSEMKANPPKQRDPKKVEALGNLLKEFTEHKRRKAESVNRKYF